MKIRSFLAIVIAGIILFACSGIKLQKYPSEVCQKLPGDKTLNIIKERCSLCHKGDFASKELICGRKNIIINSISTGKMPKYGKLSENELKTILKWEI